MNEQGPCKNVPDDLAEVCGRVRDKIANYQQYNFSQKYNNFLKAFFDLAQEYDSLHDFYRVCVSVPREMIGVASSLYLCRGEDMRLYHICSSEVGVFAEPVPAAYPVQLSEAPYEMSYSYVVPIISKHHLSPDQINGGGNDTMRQQTLWGTFSRSGGKGVVLGMYEVRSPEPLEGSAKFFFAKYANRIGYSLDNLLIARQNKEHLQFIKSLVVDIEHNFIVPNMFFRHLFNQLKRQIDEIPVITSMVDELSLSNNPSQNAEKCHAALQQLHGNLLNYHSELVKHHSNTSLFLEALFRREHFERGHLVLYTKRCFVEKEVIIPQLEHYAARLKTANITVERPSNMLTEEFALLVDIGLLSQVYANLFSNAAKYTKEIIDHHGRPRKAMAYGMEMVQNFPRYGQSGVKFNVFTTGPEMSRQEGERLFEEGTRGQGVDTVPGTGHGLSFIRQVVEMHGGIAGYEPTPQGNNFFVILPVPPMDFSSLPAPDSTNTQV